MEILPFVELLLERSGVREGAVLDQEKFLAQLTCALNANAMRAFAVRRPILLAPSVQKSHLVDDDAEVGWVFALRIDNHVFNLDGQTGWDAIFQKHLDQISPQNKHKERTTPLLLMGEEAANYYHLDQFQDRGYLFSTP